MLRFQHIEYLWLLTSIPILVAIYRLWQLSRKSKLKKIGDLQLAKSMMPAYSSGRSAFKFFLICLSLFFGILGLANLQAGARSEKVTRKGIDLIIALDVSKSMLAGDISPNRLVKSKQFILKLLEKLNNNRIGLIIFAGKAYVSVPLTIDISALKMNLSTAGPGNVPTQGTVLGEAIKMARESFNARETKYKSIVLITDGEDHDDNALDEARKAAGEGIMINTVGIGSANGAPIWDEETQENKRDENGKEILSKLNEEILMQIAQTGQGIYRVLQNTESTAEAIATQVNSIEQKNFGDNLFVDYNSYFQFFLGAGLLFLFIDFLIPQRKKMQVI